MIIKNVVCVSNIDGGTRAAVSPTRIVPAVAPAMSRGLASDARIYARCTARAVRSSDPPGIRQNGVGQRHGVTVGSLK